jgi:hypothetical protein
VSGSPRRARGGLLAGGRCPGPSNPSTFTGLVADAVSVLWCSRCFGTGARGATGASESQRFRVGGGQEPPRPRRPAGRSEPGAVKPPVLRCKPRRKPCQSRVLVFEMWIAEVGQTHLWSVRAGAFGWRAYRPSVAGTEVPLGGGVAEHARRTGARYLRAAPTTWRSMLVHELKLENSWHDGRRLGAYAAPHP